MWSTPFVVSFLLLLGQWTDASAELQQVRVGGEIRIRFRANLNYQYEPGVEPVTRIPESLVRGRAIGANGLASRFRFDDDGTDRYYGEMQTRLHVRAEFSGGVTTFAEIESTEIQGSGFRSDLATGADTPGKGSLRLLQSYVELDPVRGLPLRIRIGRQDLNMGKGWLVGNYNTSVSGLSFDAIRATATPGNWTVDAWWSKLNERYGGDNDVDFYCVYATYAGFTPMHASVYWLGVRDGKTGEDTHLSTAGEWIEAFAGLDQYEPTFLHTVGTRVWGQWGALDYDGEFAYQFGPAGAPGHGFKPMGGRYGDGDARFGNFGTDMEIGYTTGWRWSPRFYLGAAWYQGHDRRKSGGGTWLNPFDSPEASLSFNRLFATSTTKYSIILDSAQVLSNFKSLRAGYILTFSERTDLGLEAKQFWVDEVFDRPATAIPILGFWTVPSDGNIGLQTSVWGKHYLTTDLWVRFRWEHLFSGQAIDDGNFIDRNGLEFLQGRKADDADYLETMVGIKF